MNHEIVYKSRYSPIYNSRHASRTSKSKIVAIVILITVAFIIFIIILQLSRPSDTCFKSLSLEYVRNNLKTGDLLGVSYTTFHGKLVRIFTGSDWTHLGLVLFRGGQPYVIEIARYDADNKGVIIKPLDTWIDWNKNRTLAWRSYYSTTSFPEKELDKLVKETQHYDENMNVATWLRTMYRQEHNYDENKSSYYCTEYIGFLLQEIGVLKKKYKPGNYQPWEYVYGSLPCRKNHAYSSARIIKM